MKWIAGMIPRRMQGRTVAGVWWGGCDVGWLVGVAHAPSPDVRWPMARRMRRRLVGRDSPCPVAGRSLRPSWASLTPRKLRSAIHGSAGFLGRLSGHGLPRPMTRLECQKPPRSALHCQARSEAQPRAACHAGRPASTPIRADRVTTPRRPHAIGRPEGGRPGGGPASSPGPWMARRALKPEARLARRGQGWPGGR